jgi:beta propeller repeat protein
LIVVLLSLAAFTVASATDVVSSDVYVNTRLAPSDPRGNMDASVSGDRVVWRCWVPADSKYVIYTWVVGDTGPTKLTDSAANGDLPQVSGDRVVWKGSDGSDNEIFTWTLAGGIVQLTDNAFDDDLPQVSGDRVVWKGSDGSDNEIFTWAYGDTSNTQLTNNAVADDLPQVSGDRVTWQGKDGTDYEIFTWEPVGGLAQLTNDTIDDLEPQISGDRIAWFAKRGYDTEIFTWAAGDTGVTQLTDDTFTQEDVHVSGDRLVWKGWDGNCREIYTQVIGETAVKVTDNAFDDYDPQVDGDRLAWFSDDAVGGTAGVYTGIPGSVVVAGLSPNHGIATGGTVVTITGKGFTDASAVSFGTLPAIAYTVDSDIQITATAPALAANVTVRVTVTAPGGVSLDNAYDEYLYEASGVNEVFKITKVTDDEYDKQSPKVSGDRLTWYGFDGNDYEIFTWVLGDTSPTQLTSNDYNDYAPRISGDRIAWYGYQGDDTEVFTWAEGDIGPTQVPDSGSEEGDVSVSGNRLVWQAWDGNDSEIFTWVVGDETATQLTSNSDEDFSPRISGNRVVWQAWDGNDYEIFTWVVGGGSATQLTSDEYDDQTPQVSGDMVAWTGYDHYGFDQEIFYWTPTSGVIQLTDDDVYEANPGVCDGCVVWEGYDSATSSYMIYGWSSTTGKLMLSDTDSDDDLSRAQVGDHRVVWASNEAGEIETWTTANGLVEIDTGSLLTCNPAVDGNVLTWTGYDEPGGNFEIYVGTLAQITVEGLDPRYGQTVGGTQVTIEGTGFTDASTVTFGGNAATAFTVVSDTQITATAPAGDEGVVNVRVRSPLGLSPNTDADDFVYCGAAPSVTSIEPAIGPIGGANQVVVTGSDFCVVQGVTFGGTPATSYRVDSTSQITATAPGHAVGTVQVQVITPAGTSTESGATAYQYVSAPTISSLGTSGGPYAGGTTVVITGTGFAGVAKVAFGPARALAFTVDSTTQITATSPSWWWGGTVQVQVTAAGGMNNYSVGADYAYTVPEPTEDFVTTRLDLETNEQYVPQVDGSRVVWECFEGEDFEIETWTPEGGTVSITDNRRNDLDPQVSGDRIAWKGYDGNDYEIFTWTPIGGIVQVTDDDYDDYAVQVSGDRLAWIGGDSAGHDYEVHTWTPTGGITHLTTDEDFSANPQVSGDRVVWVSYEGQSFEVYSWTPTEGTVQISDEDWNGFDPQVSGDRVVWWGSDENNNDHEIFTWTPTDGAVQLTKSAEHSFSPQVSGDRLVWYMWDGYDYEIITWTPTDGMVTVTDNEADETNPQVDGDRLVWQGYDGHDIEIVTWTPTGGAIRLTDTNFRDLYPQVSGDRVVWQGMDSLARHYETCMAVPDTPLILGAAPDLGMASGGSTVTILGRNFTGVNGVNFGGVPATSYEVKSPSEIVVTTPAHEGGKVQVEVETNTGANSDNGAKDDFVYLAASSAEQTDVKITYVGSWSTVASSSASAGDYAFTSSGGSGALIKFQGTGLELQALTGRWCGIGYVRVDDEAEVAVDFYSATTTYKTTVYDTGDLTLGEHTLYVRYSGTKNVNATGYGINVDALQLQGSLAQAPAPARHEQNDPNVKYVGSWTSGWTESASGGSFRYASGTGAALNVVFEGTYLAWYAKTGPGYGKARVSLDGGAAVYVDLYSGADKYKQRVYQTGMLASGPHNLSIYWLGQKNPAAVGYRVAVDTFDVVGDLAPAADPAPVTWLYQQNDPNLTYLGNWLLGSSKYASGGSLMSTSSASAAVTVKFTGTSLVLLARSGPNHGIARVSVDGAPAVAVDLYGATTVYQRRAYSTGVLEYGQHTVTISRASTKNAKSTGYSIDVDALQVTGTLTQATKLTRYQQSDAKLTYTAGWWARWTWASSGGSYRLAGSAGTQVTVKFDGTYLSWVAMTGPGYGKARVILDGGSAAYVDLYTAANLYKQTVYSTGVLTSGSHTLTIQWSGTKNPVAKGKLVGVDAFDILGTLE